MAKNRINLSLSEEKMEFLAAIAHGRNKQVGTIARSILEDALESYEDKLWLELILDREKSAQDFVSWDSVQEKFKDK